MLKVDFKRYEDNRCSSQGSIILSHDLDDYASKEKIYSEIETTLGFMSKSGYTYVTDEILGKDGEVLIESIIVDDRQSKRKYFITYLITTPIKKEVVNTFIELNNKIDSEEAINEVERIIKAREGIESRSISSGITILGFNEV